MDKRDRPIAVHFVDHRSVSPFHHDSSNALLSQDTRNDQRVPASSSGSNSHPLSENSTWTALRNPVFRNMWLASLISGACVAAQDTAATWTMNRVSTSPLFLSLMATVASLPFFFFTLPAGALADMVDRKRMMFVMTVWLAIAAGGLALTGWFHLINPWILLIAVFLIGTGFASYSPAWTSLQPEIVSNDELPSASTLGGLQLNISGIIGPAIGGVLLRFVNPNAVFAMNSLCFLLLLLAIYRLKHPKPPSNLPLENFLESFVSAIRYVRYAPGIQVVLARNLLFAFFISIIPALIPVVGLKELHLDPSNLGLVFTCMGIGSVLGAVFILPWARARFHSNTVTLLANILVAVVFFMMATIREPMPFMVAAGLAGTAWTMAASELWVAGQRAMDEETILNSVRKTHRALVVEANKPFCSVGAQIAATLQENIFDELDAPVGRLSAIDAPAIYSPDFTQDIEHVPPKRTVHFDINHDRHRAVMRRRNVNEFVGRPGNRSRLKIELTGEINR